MSEFDVVFYPSVSVCAESSKAGVSDLASNWAFFATIGTNLGLLRLVSVHFGSAENWG